MPQVTELGKALTSEDLKGRTFILAGFTGAKGSETYNQGLSERPPDAVKQFLKKSTGLRWAI
jgi:outer membrane protein OmpA-like peptidoglycan-associated protein